MADDLGRISIPLKTGREPFHKDGRSLDIALVEFWRWSSSDLLANTTRGVVAEFLVAAALGVTREPRVNWDAVDVVSSDGVRVEVKSSAYLQSWKQARPSAISFGIAPTRGWDAASNTSEDEARRSADVYVFRVLTHRDAASVDPMNVAQWDFYVLPTSSLDDQVGAQRTISLARLEGIGAERVSFAELADAVARAASRNDARPGERLPSGR